MADSVVGKEVGKIMPETHFGIMAVGMLQALNGP